ncbi:hypothetical protein HOL59_02950, partial [Candidatus Woesearchaeota archaeon]|nr:hypothetical protein [Candidatus Woesearchaeota archaeon]
MTEYIKTIPKRKSLREDSYFVNDDLGIYLFGDGLSGSNGTIGSVLATSLIGHKLESELTYHGNNYQSESEIKDLISKTVIEANKRLISITNGESTIHGLLLRNDQAYVVHVGDGRIYRVQKNESAGDSSPIITQITKDHSLEQVMCDTNPKGKIEDYLVKDTNRGPLFHMGKELFTRVPVFENSQRIEKDFRFEDLINIEVYPVKEGDKYLLVSDGLTSRVTNNEIMGQTKEYLLSKEFFSGNNLLNNLENIRQSPKEMLEHVIRNYDGKEAIISLVNDFIGDEHVKYIKNNFELHKQDEALYQLLIDSLPHNQDLKDKLTEKLKYDDTLMIWVDTDNIEQKYQNLLGSLTDSQEPVLNKLKEWSKEIEQLKKENSIYLIDTETEKSNSNSIEGRIDDMLTSLVETNKGICLIYQKISNSLELPLDNSPDIYSFFDDLGTKQVELNVKIEDLYKKKKLLVEEKDKLTEDKNQLTEDKDKLTEDKVQLTEEKDKLTEEKVQLTEDKDKLTEDKVQLTEDKDQLTEDKDKLTEEKVQLTEDKKRLISEKQYAVNKVIDLYENILSTVVPEGANVNLDQFVSSIVKQYEDINTKYIAERNANELNQPILDEYKRLKNVINQSNVADKIGGFSDEVEVITTTLSDLNSTLEDHTEGYDGSHEINDMIKNGTNEFDDLQSVITILPEDLKRKVNAKKEF